MTGAPKRRGDRAEREACAALQDELGFKITRRYGAGEANDRGDLSGLPGFVVQVAYLVTPKIEPFARYDYSYLPLGSTTSLITGEVQEITLGANYYVYKHNVKITFDASWLPNGAPSDADALGILKDSGHNEFVGRVQFQLAI